MDTLSLLAPLRPGVVSSKIHGSRKFVPTAWQSTIERSQTCGSILHAFIHNDEKRFESKRIVCAASQCSIQQNDKVSGVISQTKEFKNKLSYSFWSEADGPVKVSVMETEAKFVVYILVLSLSCGLTDLELIWSIFRYDPSSLIAQGSKKFIAFTKNPFTAVKESSNSICVPFDQRYFDGHVVSLEFPSAQAPFFVSFKLHASPDSFSSSGSVFRTHKDTDFCIPVGIGRGHPMPLGVSYSSDGSVNFSIFSKNAESVVLCLYTSISNESSLEIALDPFVNRTGDVWHVKMANCQNYVAYGYRCKGDILWDTGSRFHMRYVLLDPYAKILGNFFPSQEQQRLASLTKCLGLLQKMPVFDWGNDVHPHIPMEKLVVYKLNVGLFTEDTSSQLSANLMGTFAGLEKKINHFKNLGVNAILLDPIFSFDETKGPYFPYNFFSPMNNYGPEKDGVSSITSMKNMVKSLHAEGIELLLQVVFSHTAEGDDADCQMITFRGIDNSVYYNVEGDIGRGANNSLNCNNPIVQGMILESLRYWVSEFRIDGFCFVNTSALVQGSGDHSLSRPPLIEAIASDPLLSKTKIVADFWSPVDISYKKVNFPHWKRFAEMNLQFCFDVRNFLRGGGLLCDIATRVCGSGDIFSDGRGPSFAFNFISKNLSLIDLVSYNDGSEQSWNCGEEGPTINRGVIELRQRQIRNFLFILFISLGVPVMTMGDECGLSTSFNNRRAFDWTCLNSSFGIENVSFIAFLSSLRSRRNDLLQVRNFLKVENIEWHGSDESFLDWNNPFACKFLGMLLKANRAEISSSCSDKGNLFAVFNASGFPLNATLPQLPWGSFWVRLVDTALPFPCFFANYDDPDAFSCGGLNSYQLQPHSCALFEAKKGGIRA